METHHFKDDLSIFSLGLCTSEGLCKDAVIRHNNNSKRQYYAITSVTAEDVDFRLLRQMPSQSDL